MSTNPVEGWPFPLDPSRNYIISAFGAKGGGKTFFQRLIYRDWPTPKLCIDVNGEADPGPGSVLIRKPAKAMPAPVKGEPPADLHYIVDPGSERYREDLDDAVGMAMTPPDRHSLVWCGEVGEFTTGARTDKNLRRLLQQSRHFRTSVLFDGPRPCDIDPLVLHQSDIIACFDMPNPKDQERVANSIGIEPSHFKAEAIDCWSRGPYWHLLYSRSAPKTLFKCPPLGS